MLSLQHGLLPVIVSDTGNLQIWGAVLTTDCRLVVSCPFREEETEVHRGEASGVRPYSSAASSEDDPAIKL